MMNRTTLEQIRNKVMNPGTGFDRTDGAKLLAHIQEIETTLERRGAADLLNVAEALASELRDVTPDSPALEALAAWKAEQ